MPVALELPGVECVTPGTATRTFGRRPDEVPTARRFVRETLGIPPRAGWHLRLVRAHAGGLISPGRSGRGEDERAGPFGILGTGPGTTVGSRLMPATCAFCAIIRGETPAVTILETERLIAFLDHRPLFHGHTLLAPKQHMRLLSELPAEQVPEFFTTAQRLERAVEDGLGADGSMVLINNVVSQSVPHLHLHVIPRNKGDGLRFWLGPRHPYDEAHPAEGYAEKIRAALPS